jgi:hypothetical protein
MLGVEAARHQRVLLYELQAIGEDVGRNTGQALLEVLEPAWAPKEIADQEKGPAIAHQLERLRDRARLTIALGHGPSVPAA